MKQLVTLKGYKFLSHKSIAYFIAEVLLDNKLAERFDRYRKIRNRINYYGDEVAEETIKETLIEIPQLVNHLKKHLK